MRVEVTFESIGPTLRVIAQTTDDEKLLAAAFRYSDLQAHAVLRDGYSLQPGREMAQLVVTVRPPPPLVAVVET